MTEASKMNYSNLPLDEQQQIRETLFRYGGKLPILKRMRATPEKIKKKKNKKVQGGKLKMSKRDKARFVMNPWLGTISWIVQKKKYKKEIQEHLKTVDKYGVEKVYNTIRQQVNEFK